MKRLLIVLLILAGARAWAANLILKQSTATTITVAMVLTSDLYSGGTGKTLTIWATKAGSGAGAAITPTVTEVSSANAAGVYALALTGTHTNTLGELQLHITASGCAPADYWFQVSARLPDDLAFPNTSGRGLNVSSGGVGDASLAQILGSAFTEDSGGLIAAAFKKFFNKSSPTGTINSIPDAVAGASGGVAIVGSNMGTVTGNTGDVSGKVLGGGSSTITGTGVRAVDGSGNAIAPASATTALQSDTDDLQSRTPAALVGGRMDSSVGAMAANTMTASALATDAVTEIVAGVLAGVVDGTLTVGNALMYITAAVFNTAPQTAGTNDVLALKHFDGSTALATQTIAGAGTGRTTTIP